MNTEVFELFAQIESKHWWFVARRRIISKLVDSIFPEPQGKKILDIGCGTGANIAEFADRFHSIGIDPSPEGVRLAKQRFPSVKFVEGLAPKDLDREDLNADLFMLNDVLEHVPDDFEMLSQLMSEARPGTYFLVTVPADMALWSPHDEANRHYRRYSADRFQSMWQGLPVDCLLCSHFNSRLYPLVRTIRSLNRVRKSPSGVSGTDLSVPHPLVNRQLLKVFEGEGARLQRVMEGRDKAYSHGVSLIALLQTQEEKIVPRKRPVNLSDPVRAWAA